MSERIKKRVRKNADRQTAYKEVVEKAARQKKKTPDQLKLLINPEDTPENPLTFHRLMDWLANTGWVEGYVRKRISPMDANLYEDYVQTIWCCILQLKQDVIMEVWYHGKGQFVNYMKKVIDFQLQYKIDAYHLNKHFLHTHITLSDEQWQRFEDGEPDSTFIDSYPVRCECPTGNRKKMVMPEYEERPISTDYNLLIDNQIHPLIDE